MADKEPMSAQPLTDTETKVTPWAEEACGWRRSISTGLPRCIGTGGCTLGRCWQPGWKVHLLFFLDNRAATMPCMALRHTIKQLDQEQREHYLSLKAATRVKRGGIMPEPDQTHIHALLK